MPYLNEAPKVLELINSLTQHQWGGVICVFARVGLINTESLSISHVWRPNEHILCTPTHMLSHSERVWESLTTSVASLKCLSLYKWWVHSQCRGWRSPPKVAACSWPKKCEKALWVTGFCWECKLPFRPTKNSFLCKPGSVGRVVKFTANSFLGGHSSLSKVYRGLSDHDRHTYKQQLN